MTYNPQNLYQCEVEKEKTPRGFIDGAMVLVGVVASFSSVPQIIKIWQTGDVAGISLITQLIALVSVCAWFAYGIYIKNRPLVVTTLVSIAVLAIVVAQIVVFS